MFWWCFPSVFSVPVAKCNDRSEEAGDRPQVLYQLDIDRGAQKALAVYFEISALPKAQGASG
jgi:hypothetical protein